MNEDKATRYHRLGRRAGLLSTLWTAVMLCALIFSGASVGLRQQIEEISRAIPLLTVVLYVLILSATFDPPLAVRFLSVSF